MIVGISESALGQQCIETGVEYVPESHSSQSLTTLIGYRVTDSQWFTIRCGKIWRLSGQRGSFHRALSNCIVFKFQSLCFYSKKNYVRSLLSTWMLHATTTTCRLTLSLQTIEHTHTIFSVYIQKYMYKFASRYISSHPFVSHTLSLNPPFILFLNHIPQCAHLTSPDVAWARSHERRSLIPSS